MNIRNLSNPELGNRMIRLVQTERKVTHLILECISEIDRRRSYLDADCTSMYDYLTKHCGYTESCALRRMSAVKILRAVPEIAGRIESGALNLSQICMVQKVAEHALKTEGREMDVEEKRDILKKIEGATQKATELILAQEFMLPIPTQQRQIIHRDGSVTLNLHFSKEQIESLKLVQDLVAHAVREKDWSELFVHLAQKEIKRRAKPRIFKSNQAAIKRARVSSCGAADVVGVAAAADPVQTEVHVETAELKRNFAFKARASTTSTTAAKSDNVNEYEDSRAPQVSGGSNKTRNLYKLTRRRPIGISVRKFILNRDQGCQHLDPASGKKCGSKRFMQIDHIQPIWAGGTDEAENLQIMCAHHNQMKYRNESGIRFVP